ncbi:MAG: DMT family transporter [Bdellovibrio sp.]|nr:DMT family transporter [Bdellovibrio sp.]
MSKQLRALLEIFTASFFWGFGFIATMWAMDAFTASLTLVYRFLIATLVSVIILLIRRKPIINIKSEFKQGAIAGVLMGVMLLFQAYGLESTSATKNSFITSFYIFFVPVIAFVFFRKKIFIFNLILIAVALFGCSLLFDMKMESIQRGDLWTILCSVVAAIHILYIGYASKQTQDAFLFNTIQGFFALITVSIALLFEHQKVLISDSTQVWAGVFFLALFSSLIAFYLQVKSQKVISDSTISMMCLLEAPFAAFFAFLFLSEKLSPLQLGGTALILVASFTQCYWESRKI